jgi:hypothetical protein
MKKLLTLFSTIRASSSLLTSCAVKKNLLDSPTIKTKNSLILILITTSFSYAQEFEIKKVYYPSLGLNKIKSTVNVTDSVISFDYKNAKIPNDSFLVTKINTTETHKIYYVKLQRLSDYEGRLTLSKNDIYKKSPYLLLLESKDNFTGEVIRVIYFLKKKI